MNKTSPNTQALESCSRIQKAPENFLSQDAIADITQHGTNEERRGFLRKSFVAALGGASAIVVVSLWQIPKGTLLFWRNKNGKPRLVKT